MEREEARSPPSIPGNSNALSGAEAHLTVGGTVPRVNSTTSAFSSRFTAFLRTAFSRTSWRFSLACRNRGGGAILSTGARLSTAG